MKIRASFLCRFSRRPHSDHMSRTRERRRNNIRAFPGPLPTNLPFLVRSAPADHTMAFLSAFWA